MAVDPVSTLITGRKVTSGLTDPSLDHCSSYRLLCSFSPPVSTTWNVALLGIQIPCLQGAFPACPSHPLHTSMLNPSLLRATSALCTCCYSECLPLYHVSPLVGCQLLEVRSHASDIISNLALSVCKVLEKWLCR